MLHLSTVLQDVGFSGFSGLLGFEKKKKKTMSSAAVPWDSWPGGGIRSFGTRSNPQSPKQWMDAICCRGHVKDLSIWALSGTPNGRKKNIALRQQVTLTFPSPLPPREKSTKYLRTQNPPYTSGSHDIIPACDPTVESNRLAHQKNVEKRGKEKDKSWVPCACGATCSQSKTPQFYPNVDFPT